MTDRLPTIHQFREAYHSLERRLADEMSRQRGLLEPESTSSKVPEWVQVKLWCIWAREPREMRSFIYERDHGEPPFLSLNDVEALRDQWVAAGRPGFQNVGQIIDAVAARA